MKNMTIKTPMRYTAIKYAVGGMINSYVEHFTKGHLVGKIRSTKDENSAMVQMDCIGGDYEEFLEVK